MLPFAKANTEQLRRITNLLDYFCLISGLKVSKEKSHIYISKGVTCHKKNRLAQVCGFRCTKRITNYLGFRMFQGRICKADFETIMDRVNGKLASWKGRLLDKPGRVVLANSVLAALPTYNMQICWFPQHVCDFLDKTGRSFIWKGTGERGMHMVNWRTVTRPKKYGGLGVRKSKEQNVALLGKLIWDIMHPNNKLWAQVLKALYIPREHILSVTKRRGSPIWSSIIKALEVLSDGYSFKIGDGDTNIWKALEVQPE